MMIKMITELKVKYARNLHIYLNDNLSDEVRNNSFIILKDIEKEMNSLNYRPLIKITVEELKV